MVLLKPVGDGTRSKALPPTVDFRAFPPPAPMRKPMPFYDAPAARLFGTHAPPTRPPLIDEQIWPPQPSRDPKPIELARSEAFDGVPLSSFEGADELTPRVGPPHKPHASAPGRISPTRPSRTVKSSRQMAADLAEAKEIERLRAVAEENILELSFQAMSVGAHEDSVVAAERFDAQSESHAANSRQLLGSLSRRPQSRRTTSRFDNEMYEIRLQRYVGREPVKPETKVSEEKAVIKRRSRKPRWRLDQSCWQQRAGASEDLLESSDCLRRLYEFDWAIAQRAHELSWHIIKTSYAASAWKGLNRQGDHPEVNAVGEVLWRHHRLIYGAFDYYAALKSESETVKGEPDIFNVSFNGFTSFVAQCRLANKQTSVSALTFIFSLVNAEDKDSTGSELQQLDRFNTVSNLNRQEWLQLLVRIAVALHVPRDSVGNVAEAVDKLVEKNLRPNLPSAALQDSNAFRKKVCYQMKTSEVLEKHMPSLSSIYVRYAESQQLVTDVLRDDSAMSVGEWLNFCQHLGLVESGQLSIYMAKVIFLWSRIRTAGKEVEDMAAAATFNARMDALNRDATGIDLDTWNAKKRREFSRKGVDPELRAQLEKSESKLRHMTFCDFLEGLVRMATILALPTDIEVEEAGAADAGDLLIAMQRDSPSDYRAFLDSHRPKQAEGAWDSGGDPLDRRLEHVILLLVRTVENNTSAVNDAGAADGVVQDDEIRRFLKSRSAGGNLNLKTTIEEGSMDFRAAQLRALLAAAATLICLAWRGKAARKKVAQRRRGAQAASIICMAWRKRCQRRSAKA